MIKSFFTKKENIFIILISFFCIAGITLGFLLLFFKSNSNEGPKDIPNDLTDIVWAEFKSKLVSKEIFYPKYMYVNEQKDESGTGINFVEFESSNFLNYFSNQNHVSIYPSGIDTPLFYSKTRESDFTSNSGQEYLRTEFLTTDDVVWAVMLVPKQQFENWQARGFIWIQSRIRERGNQCVSDTDVVIDSVDCDPYAGQKTVYSGVVSDQFIRIGYEIVNKNIFK